VATSGPSGAVRSYRSWSVTTSNTFGWSGMGSGW
jgi:hypothetical protein